MFSTSLDDVSPVCTSIIQNNHLFNKVFGDSKDNHINMIIFDHFLILSKLPSIVSYPE